MERTGLSSSLWKRQVGRRPRADHKSVAWGRTPALSVFAPSKWKHGWSRITLPNADGQRTERSRLLRLALLPCWAAFWVDIILISCRRHVLHARMLLVIFDLIKDTLSFLQASWWLAAVRWSFLSSSSFQLCVLRTWILQQSFICHLSF